MTELPPEYDEMMQRMIEEQQARDKASQVKAKKSDSREEVVYEVDLPHVTYHRPSGSSASTGYTRGQVEMTGRGTRHMSHPPDNEKV